MDESEQALLDATDAKSKRESRIAEYILSDPEMHRLWEARHAELVRPVAAQGKRAHGLESRLSDLDSIV